MAFFKEFKEFALKGNVMDMAVGVIIGGAFGKIVSSLVNDILMPPIGALLGNTDFSQLRLDISKMRDVTSSAVHSVGNIVGDVTPEAVQAAEPIWWNYGAFIQQCVDFHDPGALRLPDGQADEPADEEKGGSARPGAGTRAFEGGATAHRNPRPAQGAAERVAARRRRNGGPKTDKGLRFDRNPLSVAGERLELSTS